MSEIRRLTKEDAAELFPLRLRGLQEHPEAFGASYEDEVKVGIERWETSLADANRAMFGAFVQGKLLGMVLISRETGKKKMHRMGITAMYVAPEAQKLGLGQALITACIDYAKAQIGVKIIDIGVTVGNHTARRLYRRNGFTTWGVNPNYLSLEDGSLHDLEWMILSLT
jgi:ribosomal protein S18 acetylase RimI-like enzyme